MYHTYVHMQIRRDMRNRLLMEKRKLTEGKFETIYMDADRPFLDRKEAFRLRMRLKDLRAENPHGNIYIKQRKLYVNDLEVDSEQPLRHVFSNH